MIQTLVVDGTIDLSTTWNGTPRAHGDIHLVVVVAKVMHLMCVLYGYNLSASDREPQWSIGDHY